MNFSTHTLRSRGVEHALSFYEVELLRLLDERIGQPVSRDEILQKIWGLEAAPTNRTVDNFIVKLRKKIEKHPDKPEHILTVYGYGYKLAAPEPTRPEPRRSSSALDDPEDDAAVPGAAGLGLVRVDRLLAAEARALEALLRDAVADEPRFDRGRATRAEVVVVRGSPVESVCPSMRRRRISGARRGCASPRRARRRCRRGARRCRSRSGAALRCGSRPRSRPRAEALRGARPCRRRRSPPTACEARAPRRRRRSSAAARP